ncbi:uncharacterized protein C8R40DRAFT_1164525 [Lentinula edodes]|uniref:uncharacterized protein n=1 Tax=Lentinula edodes TaxID=5353 RepID=UPI001E8E3CF9|nr:uncharacterized protein C8R40DRAFT_1164525 [Lentinula edodes]KAH7881110.1 hypothetical protein C8R40DRAFT_1164525 [Lentinula edodes]
MRCNEKSDRRPSATAQRAQAPSGTSAMTALEITVYTRTITHLRRLACLYCLIAEHYVSKNSLGTFSAADKDSCFKLVYLAFAIIRAQERYAHCAFLPSSFPPMYRAHTALISAACPSPSSTDFEPEQFISSDRQFAPYTHKHLPMLIAFAITSPELQSKNALCHITDDDLYQMRRWISHNQIPQWLHSLFVRFSIPYPTNHHRTELLAESK